MCSRTFAAVSSRSARRWVHASVTAVNTCRNDGICPRGRGG
nr:hypothetical protein [Gordonia amicalis]